MRWKLFLPLGQAQSDKEVLVLANTSQNEAQGLRETEVELGISQDVHTHRYMNACSKHQKPTHVILDYRSNL